MGVALEPVLTRADLRVLAKLPPSRSASTQAATLWEVGEALEVVDLHSVQLTLNGLHDLGYAVRASSRRRLRTVWWRTAKGDAAVAGEQVIETMTIRDVRDRLGSRAYNCLGQARLFQLEEIARATDEELFALPNFGVKCLEQVRAVVPHIPTA